MKLKKLKLDDFKAVDSQDLLEIRGAQGGYSGGCKGDPNGFGGTFDANEVVVYGVYTGPGGNPTIRQQTGSWVHQPCLGCSELGSPRSTFTPLGRSILNAAGAYHNTGCGGQTNPANRHRVWQPFN